MAMTGARPKLLLGLGALALAAAACGGTSTANNSTTSTSTTTTEGGGSGSGSGSGSATISSVVFTGSTMAPTITINGSGFGMQPTPDPTYAPAGTQLCPLAPPAGDQGLDYGTNLYVFDVPRNWAGGRYRPQLNELDCVGLLISKFTATQVVLQFGAAYAQYQQKDNYLLAEGDAYQIAVNGASFSGTVHYT